MYDARTKTPAQLVDTDGEELDQESIPAVDLDPEEDQPLTDAAAGDAPEVEPIFGD